jgi:phosphatidylserine/phosphatidylglycerophosphate/cardiolipin synthase-like enzyme
MVEQPFDRILRKTLSDYRLSRGERRVLSETLRQMDADERQLAVLRHRAFEIAREELIGPEALAVVDWLEDVVKVIQPQREEPVPSDEVYFSPGDHCPNKITSLLRLARRSADICVFTITDDRITDAILEAHRRGVTIRIITDNEKSEDLGSDIDRLEQSGVPLRVDRTEHHMHHKFAVFDDRTAVTGSYNWTRSAAKYNEENLVVTHDRGLIDAFGEAFRRLWESLG